MKKIYIFTKVIFQIFLYLVEIIGISVSLAYLTKFISDTTTSFEFFERIMMCYTIYQILVIVILTNINDIKKDSTLAYITILKKCLLYIDTKEIYVKENILSNIDYQLKTSTLNNSKIRNSYILIKNNIDNLTRNNINMELIKAESIYETCSLNWKFSFLLRIFKNM